MRSLSAAVSSEFLGTMLLVVLGDGVVATAFLLGHGDWMVITTGWGVAVALAVYVSFEVSGGHINPAVTVALAMRRGFPWSRVLPYCAAQVAGALAGGLLVYAAYFQAFRAFETEHQIVRGVLVDGMLPGPAAGGAAVFATFPTFPEVPLINLFAEVLGTWILVLVIFALVDRRNHAPLANLEPLLIGCVVWGIGLSLGGLTGYAINPARDLGPRLAAALVGWGPSVFRSHGGHFWIPLVGPLVGGALGAATYDALIGRFLDSD